MSSARRFTIFGAGLSGALIAVLLARRGHRVELHERRPDPRVGPGERGRSINLALSTRGIAALERAGLDRVVLDTAIAMKGRMIHPVAGPLAFHPYSVDPEKCINSVSRSGLNMTLLNEAQRTPGVTIHFGRRCLGMDFDTRRANVLDVATGLVSTIDTETVIAADGAFSGVRSSMQKRDRFDYAQSYLEHGYKELTIPPAHGRGWRIEKHALHIWPRGTYMMIALPNQDGSFTCTLFWPFEGPNSFAALRDPASITSFFESQFPDAIPLIPDLVDDFMHNPTASLVTIRCRPWHVEDAAVLVGDAAHAVVPFYGQGMNASFEDCVALDECIAEDPADLASAYTRYAARRVDNTDALARLAVDNFVEMRDKVSDPDFVLRKRVEHAFERLFPRFKSLYEMVTFSTIPYAEARERALRLDALIASIESAVFRALGEWAVRAADQGMTSEEAHRDALAFIEVAPESARESLRRLLRVLTDSH